MKRKFLSISDPVVLFLIACFGVLVHALLNGQYGFHRDELDILMNARRLAWGYVAYPPFTPFIARIGLVLFGNSLIGLRLFSAISQGVVIFLAGSMAHDMGGKRNAQIVAAIAVGIAPAALTAGTLIQYMSFDFMWWVVIAFFFVRLLAKEEPRYWLGIGASIGLGMMTKYTVAFWVVGLVIALLLSARRKDLLSKWLWLGAVIALIIYLPNLVWQIQHNFISLRFLQAIHQRDLQWGRGNDFLIGQLYSSTNPLTVPLWVTGLIASVFSPALKRFRPLAWMFLVAFTIFLVSRGRPYYVAPGYCVLLASGSVWLESWLGKCTEVMRRVGTAVIYTFISAGAVGGIILEKPIVPINSPLWNITSRLNSEVVEMVGWQDLTDKVASIYQAIPEAEKPRTAILAGNYGEAGALDFYGRAIPFPPIISSADSFWYRGYGNPAPETLIVVGFDRSYAEKFFQSCKTVGIVTNRYGVRNEESTKHTGLYVCRQPRRPWDKMWTDMLWFQ